MMKGLFGTKKKEVSSEEALTRLRNTQEMLMKQQAFFEKNIEKEIATAKKHGTSNKRAALQALRRKKMLEKKLTQIDGTLTTIEFQIDALSQAGTNVQVMEAMKAASTALKSAHKNMNVDDVHDVMDDIDEQNAIANEIAGAISKPIGYAAEFDEDELLAELEELKEQDLADQLLNVGDSLPSVPDSSVPVAKTKEKTKEEKEIEELRMLEEWAS